MDDKTRGLYQKYTVERTDGKPLGEDGCIVLEWKDEHARRGIAAFADSIKDEYPVLYGDLTKLLKKHGYFSRPKFDTSILGR